MNGYYLYSVFRLSDQKEFADIDINHAADIIGIKQKSLYSLVSNIASDQGVYGFSWHPVNKKFLIARKIARGIRKGYSDDERERFSCEWNQAVEPFRTLAARRDGRRHGTQG